MVDAQKGFLSKMFNILLRVIVRYDSTVKYGSSHQEINILERGHIYTKINSTKCIVYLPEVLVSSFQNNLICLGSAVIEFLTTPFFQNHLFMLRFFYCFRFTMHSTVNLTV